MSALGKIGVMLTAAGMALAVVPGQTVRGHATVVDGDGLAFPGIRDLRLQGIAAPEDSNLKREPGGQEASANLRRIVEGHEVVCVLDGTLARGRPVGVCSVNGVDIGLLQVRQGFARDCWHFSKGRYGAAEEAARAAGHDLSLVYPLPGYCTRGQ